MVQMQVLPQCCCGSVSSLLPGPMKVSSLATSPVNPSLEIEITTLSLQADVIFGEATGNLRAGTMKHLISLQSVRCQWWEMKGNISHRD